MRIKPRPVPASVYLVADNLDAVLAAAEDLLRLEHVPDTANDRDFVDRVRTLEMAMAVRTLQARARAIDVGNVDSRCLPLVRLFVSGTIALQDAIADLSDSTATDFHSGGDAVAYLRTRCAIAADAAGLDRFSRLAITEDFMIAQRIQLGALMDLCATFLDMLEVHYDLYDAPQTASVRNVVSAQLSETSP